jgi:hypothetical protein
MPRHGSGMARTAKTAMTIKAMPPHACSNDRRGAPTMESASSGATTRRKTLPRDHDAASRALDEPRREPLLQRAVPLAVDEHGHDEDEHGPLHGTEAALERLGRAQAEAIDGLEERDQHEAHAPRRDELRACRCRASPKESGHPKVAAFFIEKLSLSRA